MNDRWFRWISDPSKGVTGISQDGFVEKEFWKCTPVELVGDINICGLNYVV